MEKLETLQTGVERHDLENMLHYGAESWEKCVESIRYWNEATCNFVWPVWAWLFVSWNTLRLGESKSSTLIQIGAVKKEGTNWNMRSPAGSIKKVATEPKFTLTIKLVCFQGKMILCGPLKGFFPSAFSQPAHYSYFSKVPSADQSSPSTHRAEKNSEAWTAPIYCSILATFFSAQVRFFGKWASSNTNALFASSCAYFSMLEVYGFIFAQRG